MSRSNHTKKKIRPPPPPPPPPKRLFLGYKSTSTGGDSDSREPYSCRSPQHTEVTFTSLTRVSGTFFGHNINVSDEVYAAEVVYLVVVRYSDGDSFGTSYGNWTVWEATASEEEALKVAKSIEDGTLVKKYEEGVRKGTATYMSIPWNGYFSHLEGVEIHSFRVADSVSQEDTESRISIHRH
jgi:hypothetical protein